MIMYKVIICKDVKYNVHVFMYVCMYVWHALFIHYI